MKTNQLMKIAFSGGDVEVFHKTAMGDLTQLWKVGNQMRVADGKAVANMALWQKSAKTKEFMQIVNDNIGHAPINVTGRGKNSRTWANIHMMVYAAEYLSARFHFEVVDAFVQGKILSYRDESGDNFKAMNIAIDEFLPGREGKDNKGLRIQVAKQIKAKVNPELVSWNFATAEDLKFRCDIENEITLYLKRGFISNYEHLKLIIEDIK
jgi:hypothetical protein